MKRLLSFVLLFCLLCTGCAAESAFVSTEMFAMDTYISLRVWGDNSDLSDVITEIRILEKQFSVTDEESDVYTLNQTGSVKASSNLLELLDAAVSFSERTDGAFDPTIYPLVQAWGFTTQEQRVPSQKELDSLLPLVGTEHLSVEGDIVTLDSGVQIDLGGIAKGYTAQKCTESLVIRGVQTAILSLGGNVQTLGTKPDGEPWVVGIADPDNPSEAIAVVSFTGSMALVTSGGYQRYFEQDGTRYHHILDPKTGCPVQNELASVTVLAQDGTLADALSTALFVMGLDEASAFWRESTDFEAVFITKDREIYATEGAAALLSGGEVQVISR